MFKIKQIAIEALEDAITMAEANLEKLRTKLEELKGAEELKESTGNAQSFAGSTDPVPPDPTHPQP